VSSDELYFCFVR